MTQEIWIFLAIGLVAGTLAGFVLGGGGLLRNLIVGVIGSFVGGYLHFLADRERVAEPGHHRDDRRGGGDHHSAGNCALNDRPA